MISEETRDHTERMLQFFGAKLRTEKRGNKVAITVTGEAELKGGDVTVPGDPSSAAFLAAAALWLVWTPLSPARPAAPPTGGSEDA